MFGPPHDPPAGSELTPLEDALSRLAPRPAALDRDAIFFRAGQAAAPRSRVWPGVALLATAAAAVLGVLLTFRPPVVVESVVYVPVPTPAAPSLPESPREPASVPPETLPLRDPGPRRRLEEHLLRCGLDGLEDPGPDPDPPPLSGELLP
jgi:hypothetical protein